MRSGSASLPTRLLAVVGLLAVVSAAVVGAFALSGGSTPASATSAGSTSSRPPFTDPSAVGYIGLCNQAGQQITSGSIDTTPFAWRAVSSEAAKAPYNNSWRTATLFMYQPQSELPVADWSGTEMTASSRYSNPANPMAAATHADQSLAAFMQEYHPVWDGYLELRIYLGTENAPTESEQYPALDVKVTGDRWQAIGGGTVNCHSGTSESIESILLPKSKTSPTTTSSPSGSGKSSSGSHGTAGAKNGKSSSGTRSGDAGSKSGASGSADSAGSKAGGSAASLASASLVASPKTPNHTPLFVILAVALLALAGTTLLVRRRRLITSPAPSGRSPDKGHRP